MIKRSKGYRKRKEKHYNIIIDTYRSDMKKTWKTINVTLSRNIYISE